MDGQLFEQFFLQLKLQLVFRQVLALPVKQLIDQLHQQQHQLVSLLFSLLLLFLFQFHLILITLQADQAHSYRIVSKKNHMDFHQTDHLQKDEEFSIIFQILFSQQERLSLQLSLSENLHFFSINLNEQQMMMIFLTDHSQVNLFG